MSELAYKQIDDNGKDRFLPILHVICRTQVMEMYNAFQDVLYCPSCRTSVKAPEDVMVIPFREVSPAPMRTDFV